MADTPIDFSSMEASVKKAAAIAQAAGEERRAQEIATGEVLTPERHQKSCLSYWFPKIEALSDGAMTGRLFVPRTVIIRAKRSLIDILDGERAPDDIKAEVDRIASEIKTAADGFGYPAFLRTGQGSGKHVWKDTCFIAGPENIGRRVFNLVEWSEMVDFMGLPTNVWVVREFLKGDVAFHAFMGEMPVAREFRVITKDGKVGHIQPYWPGESIEDPADSDWLTKLEDHYLLDEAAQAHLGELSAEIARAIGDDWSMDWFYVPASKRWYLTDMAPADQSYQWEGRPNGKPTAPVPRPSVADFLLSKDEEP
jgi:hypothetical protein